MWIVRACGRCTRSIIRGRERDSEKTKNESEGVARGVMVAFDCYRRALSV
jgi:hypothetical protein